MQIPDPMVYACLPVLGGAAVWVCRQFVQSVTTSKPRDPATAAVSDLPSPVMSLRDYRNFSKLLKEDLNGRYMLATEARTRFEAIETKIDQLKDFIRDHGGHERHEN